MTSVTQPFSQLINKTPTSSSAGSTPSGTQGTINSAQQSLASDQQTFLKLLTTQLQNQDPLSPLDTNQFTQQLVAMTGVQQQIVSNQLLQQLVNNQSGVGDPVGLIGKTVTVQTNQAALQNGQANWLYSLPTGAAKTQLQVYDSNDQLVWKSDVGSLPSGEHAFTWNGKDLAGVQHSDGGPYMLKVVAADAKGGVINPSVYQRGVASSVEQQGGQAYLDLNGIKVPASAVLTVGLGA